MIRRPDLPTHSLKSICRRVAYLHTHIKGRLFPLKVHLFLPCKMCSVLCFFVLWGYRQHRKNAHPLWWAKWFSCSQLPIGCPRQAELAPKCICYILAGIVSLRTLGQVHTPRVPPFVIIVSLQARCGLYRHILANVGSCQSSVLFYNHTNMSQSRKMRFPCLSHSHFCCCRNEDFTAFAVFKVSQGICNVNTQVMDTILPDLDFLR